MKIHNKKYTANKVNLLDEKWCTTKSDDNDVLSYTFSFDFIIVFNVVQIVYLDYKTPNVEIQTKIASYNIFRVVI